MIISLYQIILKFHVITGFIVTFIFWTILALKKNNSLHKKLGFAYIFFLILTCVTSLLSLIIFLANENELKTYTVLGKNQISYFLILMSIIPIAKIIAGYQFIKFKDDLKKTINTLNISMHLLGYLSGIVMVYIGIKFDDQAIKFFGMFGVPLVITPHFLTLNKIHKSPQKELRPHYLQWHIEAMLTSAVALHVSIVTGGIARVYFPQVFAHTGKFVMILPFAFELIARLYAHLYVRKFKSF